MTAGAGRPVSLGDAEIHRFHHFPGGGADFGMIGDDIALAVRLPPGPIRLQAGIPGDRGFGFRHIAGYPARVKQIKSLGFSGVVAFVHLVAQNFQQVAEAAAANRLALVYRYAGHDLVLIVQYNDAGFWSVTTGLPYRVSRRPVLWSRQTGGSEPPPNAPDPRPRFATLSLPKTTRGSES